MIRFWHTFLAIVATAAMVNSANAQWSPSGEIGSYQSILSRAGYGGGSSDAGFVGSQPSVQAPVQPPAGPPAGPAANGAATSYQSGTAVGGQYGGSYGGVGGSYSGGSYGGYAGGSGTTQSFGSGTTQSYGGMVNGGSGTTQGYDGMVGGVHSGAVEGAIGAAVGGVVGSGTSVVQQGVDYAGSINGGVVVDRGYTGAQVQNFAPAPVYNAALAYQAPAYQAPVYQAPTYQIEPVYVAGQSFVPQVTRRSNWVIGLFGINFRRDYEDDRRLGYSNAGDFFSTDVDHGDFDGGGVSLANRNSSGRGWQFRYWGLDEGTDVDIAGPTASYLRGFADLQHPPTGADVLSIYNAGDLGTRLTRNTEINSIEVNLLKNGGHYKTKRGRSGTYEMFGGFRIFQFDEDFQYVSNSSSAGFPARIEYASETENLLTGFQMGGRDEINLGKRLRLSKEFSAGLFNNRINTRQSIFDENGVNPVIYNGPNTGTPYSFEDRKDDAAFIGQLDVGLIYSLSHKARLRIGYRALGISGVALAVDQIPYDFTDVNRIEDSNSNGSLLLHGFYYGGEFSF